MFKYLAIILTVLFAIGIFAAPIVLGLVLTVAYTNSGMEFHMTSNHVWLAWLANFAFYVFALSGSAVVSLFAN